MLAVGSKHRSLLPAVISLLGLLSCDHSPTSHALTTSDFVGRWVDLASLPETETKDRHCCFFDSTREGNPCPPDTLTFSTDGKMSFTSLPDEPASYRIEKDTLLRIRTGAEDKPEKSAISLRNDTLTFAVAPLCPHNPMAAAYRKLP